ncbi:MAG TPA: hypothetical protein DEA08_34525, partial [Planctomycetes bacterium]|nr:hypothetical protein [Planctomycetota bacterium]
MASAAAAGLMAFGLAVAQGQDAAPERKPEHLVQVETTDGKTVKGRYRDQGDSVVLDTEDGPVEIPKANIKSVRQAEEIPAPVPATPAEAPAPADE